MKHKHLTYEDRLIIQQELENSTSLHKTAQRLRKSDSTISREIIRNRYQVKASASHTVLCARVNLCALVSLCSNDCSRTSCANCAEVCRSTRCPGYQPRYCTRLTKARTAATAAHSGRLRPAGMSSSATMPSARRSWQTTC